VSKNFAQVIVCDFEYEVTDGDLPNVLCMVSYMLDEYLQHVRTIRLWRGDFGTIPPFDISPDALFVAYSAWAEMTCFKVLGWEFPVHIFDQHTAFLAASNNLLPYNPDEVRKKPRKRLSDACRTYGLDGWECIDKEDISKAIGNGTWRDRYSPQEVVDYCEEDVKMSLRLLRAQLQRFCDQRGYTLLPAADVERVLWWSNYSAKAVALIQARGMPIDTTLWNLAQENKAAVVGELLRQFDPSHNDDDPIYTPEGEWSYQRFERWLVRSGVAGQACKQAAVRGRARCRMHGGARGSGGPRGHRNGNFKNGLWTRESVEVRKGMRARVREIKALLQAMAPPKRG